MRKGLLSVDGHLSRGCLRPAARRSTSTLKKSAESNTLSADEGRRLHRRFQSLLRCARFVRPGKTGMAVDRSAGARQPARCLAGMHRHPYCLLHSANQWCGQSVGRSRSGRLHKGFARRQSRRPDRVRLVCIACQAGSACHARPQWATGPDPLGSASPREGCVGPSGARRHFHGVSCSSRGEGVRRQRRGAPPARCSPEAHRCSDRDLE